MKFLFLIAYENDSSDLFLSAWATTQSKSTENSCSIFSEKGCVVTFVQFGEDISNEIAHTMGLKTIAEYVDSEELYAALQEIGLDCYQGFYLGRPQPLMIDNEK